MVTEEGSSKSEDFPLLCIFKLSIAVETFAAVEDQCLKCVDQCLDF